MLKDESTIPAELIRQLRPRSELLGGAFKVNARRWRTELEKRGLPRPTHHLGGDTDFIHLNRGDLFALADRDVTTDNSWQLLYHSLAWGLGTKASRLNARLDGLARHREMADRLLPEAWNTVCDGARPGDSYRVLLTEAGRPKIRWFGAAFATKYLYFAHGSGDIQNLILDQLVATALMPLAWDRAPTTAWWPTTYERYCHLMAKWAEEASAARQENVAPDQIEALLFAIERDRRISRSTPGTTP